MAGNSRACFSHVFYMGNAVRMSLAIAALTTAPANFLLCTGDQTPCWHSL